MAAVGVAATGFAQETAKPVVRKGKLKQGVTSGVFGRNMAFEDRCREAARLGAKGFDLIGPKDWPTLKKYGLLPTMVPGAGGTIPDALNRVENHAKLEQSMREMLNTCADYGAPNLITFSGNRKGMPDDEGLENCYKFLTKVKGQAEDKGVTICIEYLNSKVNHADYMFDHFKWGLELCKRVNSPRVKMLYDIYHAQIMDGDLVRNIRDNIQWIGHFHTGGNPGRHEIDETQEINYRFVAKAIADLNFTGYVSHEYSPVRDPIASLEQAMEIFDVA